MPVRIYPPRQKNNWPLVLLFGWMAAMAVIWVMWANTQEQTLLSMVSYHSSTVKEDRAIQWIVNAR